MAAKRKPATAARRGRQDVPTRQFTVLAQDPAVRGPGGRALTTRVTLPAERLEAGPKGHRVHVIDFDASSGRYYAPRATDLEQDPYRDVTDLSRLVGDPYFHQQNAYAIVMATLAEFQAALGRQVAWGFDSPAHQIKVAPHAFADANAYYSRESESLCFGYFTGDTGRTVYTCLSHDIVAHETSHALLDGLRNFYLYPSHVDQAAFHEGFSDVVALLSVLKSSELLEHSLAAVSDRRNLIRSASLSRAALEDNVLMKLGDEFGRELSAVRGDALRHSIRLRPSPGLLDQEEFQEPHRRGEILAAAVMGCFLRVWERRLDPLGRDRHLALNRAVVAGEGATAAGQLLRIVIRALDYLPPVDMTFPDYLSAILTADQQLYPNDSRYRYRDVFREVFAAFGIKPAVNPDSDGIWDPPPAARPLSYEGLHFDSMQRDPNTVFRFIWENRAALGVDPDAFTRVISLRPCVRVSNEGFVLRETLVEYVQTLQVRAHELDRMDIPKPAGLSGQASVRLYGGGTLVFDEFGRLKFHIGTGVRSKLQGKRVASLYARGAFNRDEPNLASFAQPHRRRMTARLQSVGEQW